MTHALARPRALALVALLGGLGHASPANAAGSSPAAEVPQPWLRGRIGVQVQSLTPELRELFSAPTDRGVLVGRVVSDRPAARAGLRVGDVLLEADGVPLRNPHDLLRGVASVADGDSLELLVVRDGTSRRIRVEPDTAALRPPLPPDAWQGWERWLDRGLRQGSRELRRRLEDLETRLEELERRLEPEADGARKTLS